MTNETSGSVEELALRPELRPETVRRTLVTARARFGQLELGTPVAGDGASCATFELSGERGDGLLVLQLDEASGRVARLAILQRERRAPAEGW